MAEWLRRLTRNQIPSGSVGSNPTDCERSNIFARLAGETLVIFVPHSIREAGAKMPFCNNGGHSIGDSQ